VSESPDASPAPVRRGQPVAQTVSPWPFVGMAGMACTFFLNAASVLLAPWYGVALLLAIWFALLLVGFRWWTPHPVRLAFLPVVSLVVWFGLVMAGDIWLGWTA
jgi:hypothetical protein